MTKVYKSKSIVAITIFFKKTGKSKRISFSPLTGAGSVYYSKDENEQQAIEAHVGFGRLFRLEGVKNTAPSPVAAPKPAAKNTPAPEADGKPVTPTAQAPTGSKEPVHIKFTNIPDAKEYLVNAFPDVSRTKVRTKADVKAIGLAHNVVFDGLE